MPGKNQHVVPHPRGWAVKPENAEHPTSVHKTQHEAIATGKARARNHKSELLVHGKNGAIRARSSYGNDPYPPKG
jgi:hypothetical protein